MRRSSTRTYAERRGRLRTDARRLQEQLVISVARQVRGRYSRQTKLQPMTSLADWLIDRGSLEHTFDSGSFGIDDRGFRAQRIVEEAASITLGADTSMDWFTRALEVQLGGVVSIELGPILFGKFKGSSTLLFGPPVDVPTEE